MEIKAKARFIRMSPKKVRLVANLIKGLDVEEALSRLEHTTKWATRPLIKLVDSAIANAENNFKLDKKNLYIKNLRVDQGPVMKRWMPRAHGRATMIKKRMSHIYLVLEEKVPGKGVKEEKGKEVKGADEKEKAGKKKK